MFFGKKPERYDTPESNTAEKTFAFGCLSLIVLIVIGLIVWYNL